MPEHFRDATRCASGLLFALLAAVAAADDRAVACDLQASDAATAGAGCAQAWMDAHLRLNDLQVIGTHNSYKLPMAPDDMRALRQRDPASAESLDYSHRPLAEQLDRGVRGLELDVHYDPQGGRYTHPSLPPAQRRAMATPGFKTMHLSDIDDQSHCQPFAQCLRQVRDWSQAHPRHVPILILINAKDGATAPGAVQPLPFDAVAFAALDAEIRAVFPSGTLIEPRTLQGAHPSLRHAARADAWPTLGEARGRVLFALDEGPAKVARYLDAHGEDASPVMFVNARDESVDEAAYLTLNEPLQQADRIAAAVAAGALIRTRADAETREARSGDGARRDAAFASGAHVVSTDYIDPDPRFGRYRVQLPGGGVARCNPQRAPARCAGLAIEE
ncbi:MULTISPECIES: Ca2+-dependent phosphoinositide-specific phospholipase C [Luteimonas]|uniref:Ca2+-dependent phosphoinositide-specific phospholipase C n=1 Tax=Luteimonas TaxID=83614 RepID=UPI000C7C392A|nr:MULTISPECIES: Ca2+-dependent phosphoinositide-specific phospholipase C [Luteimonas]